MLVCNRLFRVKVTAGKLFSGLFWPRPVPHHASFLSNYDLDDRFSWHVKAVIYRGVPGKEKAVSSHRLSRHFWETATSWLSWSEKLSLSYTHCMCSTRSAF
jgi:hypothetical protein